MKIFGIFGVVLIVSWSQLASACEFIDPKPEQVMALEDNLVIAFPAAISNVPLAANDPTYRQPFRQTILWTVVVSRKGPYKPGDQFTTRQNLNRSGMCSPGAGNYTKKPLLLAFSGREPYQSFWDFSVEHDLEKFQYIQKKRVRGST
ncbi:hypothetical protein GGR77_002496 [Xanthomonas translucens]